MPSSFTFPTNCGDCRGAQLDFGIELGHQEDDKAKVLSLCLVQLQSVRVANPAQLEEIWEGGNIIGNAMVLSIPSVSFPTESHRVQGSSTFQYYEKTANEGNWPSA